MNASLESQYLQKHETRLVYLVTNMLKSEDTEILTRVSSCLNNEVLGMTIILNPRGSANEAVVIFNGIPSHTLITDFAFRMLTDLIIKETKVRLSKIVDFRITQEYEKLKQITDALYERIEGEKVDNG